MALLDILHFPNPLLRKKCTKITEVNKDLYRLAEDKGKKIGKVTLDAAISALFRDKASKNKEKYK